jgi:hypothetical protein
MIVGKGEEFANREGYFAEYRAGVGAAVGGGFLIGNTVVASGEYELDNPLHADDGEHTDGNENLFGSDIVGKVAFEVFPYVVGYCIYGYAAVAEGMASFFYLYIQTNGIGHLYRYGGESGFGLAL